MLFYVALMLSELGHMSPEPLTGRFGLTVAATDRAKRLQCCKYEHKEDDKVMIYQTEIILE